MIWGNLIHLSYNMWSDVPPGYAPHLRFDDDLWDELVDDMADARVNMVVLDLGDAVRYESHPEIAVAGAWSIDRLRTELDRLHRLGIEPIPKLNFSAGHDTWLGQYSRCVSTDLYYSVCSDLIAEVAQVFDQPRYFHLGMDEEDARYQRGLQLAVVRQHELWFHDVEFLAQKVTAAGSRPWIWSDHAWRTPDTYYQHMPKDIVQSNWYYTAVFNSPEEPRPRVLPQPDRTGQHTEPVPDDRYLAFLDLDDNSYDQIPTGSTWCGPETFEPLVEFCLNRLDRDRLLGFLQSSWRPTTAEFRTQHLEAIDVLRQSRLKHDPVLTV